jgi:hypothetical protein
VRAEDREQHQQRDDDVPGVQQVGEQLGDDEPEGTTCLLQLAGVAELGLRGAVRDVDDAEHAEEQRAPADDLATGGAVGLRVAHVAPGDVAEHQRHEPREQAHRSGDHRTGAGEDRAGQLPPDRGGHDDGERDQEQTGAVAAVLGVELTSALTDPAGTGAHSPGNAEPHGGDAVSGRSEDAGHRTRTVANGPRCGPPGRARPALAPSGLSGGSRRPGPRT